LGQDSEAVAILKARAIEGLNQGLRSLKAMQAGLMSQEEQQILSNMIVMLLDVLRFLDRRTSDANV
jgi:hypothetical protein